MREPRVITLVFSVFISAWSCMGQKPERQPTPDKTTDQERIRIFTEEVIFTVKVTDTQGRFDPTLNKDELLILEDGQPQEVLSARHLTANVLLLIGMSGEL